MKAPAATDAEPEPPRRGRKPRGRPFLLPRMEPVEHLEHFGLECDPFRNEPQLEFWFSGRPHVARAGACAAASSRARSCAC